MIALENVPSGVLQARLARYAEAASARAALLLAPAGDHYAAVASWTAQDEAAIQARLLIQDLTGQNDLSNLRVPKSAFSLNALLEGQEIDDPNPLVRAAGLDPSVTELPTEVGGVRAYAVIPVGPRASQGIALVALASSASIPDLRRSARMLLEGGGDESALRPLADLGDALGVDLVRLYRFNQEGHCTVIGAWQSGGTILPEAGESLTLAGTPLQAVVDSEDAALVESSTRGDWLSALSAAQGIRTTLFSPLFGEGRLRAIIELGSRRSELPLASISERLPAHAAELIALVDDEPAGELQPYGLVRAFATQPRFREEDAVDRLCVEVLREDKRTVQFVIGGPLGSESEIAPLDGSATDDVMKGGPAIVSTERVNGWFNQALLAQGFRSVLRVPLRYQSELLGVLSIISRTPDAFAVNPEGVTTFADQLSMLVAAERGRLGLLLDSRRGDLLTRLTSTITGTGHDGVFAGGAPLIASAIEADALWLQTDDELVGWGDGALAGLPPAPRGEVRCRGDLGQGGNDSLDGELARRGYRSLLTIPDNGSVLICAARRAYAFDAESIALVTPAARLLCSAHDRESAIESAGKGLDVATLREAVVLIEPVSGEVLDLNDAARALLRVERGESLWARASEQSGASARSALATAQSGNALFEMAVEADDRRLVVEVQGTVTSEGLWRLFVHDVTDRRFQQRLMAALQEASSAAQSCSSEEQLRETVVDVLAQHDLRAYFGSAAAERSGGRSSPVDLVLTPGDDQLTIEGIAGSEAAEALEAFRTGLLATIQRLRDDEQLRADNQKLSHAVAARTAELEGLYAYSRDLNESESEEEALRVALAHISAVLATQAGATVCLEHEHFGAGPDSLQIQAENLLLHLQPEKHEACRRLLRSPHVPIPTSDSSRAVVPTDRGGGIIVVSRGATQPSQDQLKLLLSHATQLGTTLDRLGMRREAEESRLRSIADVVDEGIALVNLDGSIEAENAAAAALLAHLRQPDGTYDRQLETLVADAREASGPLGRELAAADRTILAAARSIPEASGRVALTLRDVTEQRLTQERLAQAERLAALGQLVSGVAHELNNPLTGILGFAQLLQDQPLEDDARRGVETIQSEAERAGKIIQDLLAFARRRAPVREPVDVNDLVSRVLNIRGYDIQGENIEVELALEADLPLIEGDGDQLQQVFFNVLTNAIQALRNAAGARRLSVITTSEDHWVILRITDNGPGVAPEDLSHVFEPFFTTKEPGEGTGLGLSISFGIVDAHGGTIELRNEPSGGATAEIKLPASASGASSSVDQTHDEPMADSARILVVDDEPSIREVLSSMLRAEGHDVVAVESAADALVHLSREEVHVVITDLKMPEISGQELFNEIRVAYPDLGRRVIFITGDTVNEETRAFITSVDNPTLEKPFRLERLRELIRQALA